MDYFILISLSNTRNTFEVILALATKITLFSKSELKWLSYLFDDQFNRFSISTFEVPGNMESSSL